MTYRVNIELTERSNIARILVMKQVVGFLPNCFRINDVILCADMHEALDKIDVPFTLVDSDNEPVDCGEYTVAEMMTQMFNQMVEDHRNNPLNDEFLDDITHEYEKAEQLCAAQLRHLVHENDNVCSIKDDPRVEVCLKNHGIQLHPNGTYTIVGYD